MPSASADSNGGVVTLRAAALRLAGFQRRLGHACDGSGTPACGAGSLTISAGQIVFDSGTLRTYGFGGAVTLAATSGILADGAATFDAGPANLALDTPFVGDRGTGLPGCATLPEPDFDHHRAPSPSPPCTWPGGGAFHRAGPHAGFIGVIIGLAVGVAIDRLQLRATAGLARGELGDWDFHLLDELPGWRRLGYAKTFGDAADPVTVSAFQAAF